MNASKTIGDTDVSDAIHRGSCSAMTNATATIITTKQYSIGVGM